MYVLLFHKESDMLLIDECAVEPFLEVCEFVESFQEFKHQFYIQLVFKAPLCITLTISDQKIMSGSLFLTPKEFLPIFF